MANVLEALKWWICGSYDPEGPVTEDCHIRTRNRAKWEAWKYNVFGPGIDIFYGQERKQRPYQIIDSGELQREPLYINNPKCIAGLACIIAEMEGYEYVAMLTPLGRIITREHVQRQEDEAINRVVKYLVPDKLPPVEYTEWYTDPHETLGWMNYYAPKRYPIKRVIIPNVHTQREEYREQFRQMLETLKQHNKQK